MVFAADTPDPCTNETKGRRTFLRKDLSSSDHCGLQWHDPKGYLGQNMQTHTPNVLLENVTHGALSMGLEASDGTDPSKAG